MVRNKFRTPFIFALIRTAWPGVSVVTTGLVNNAFWGLPDFAEASFFFSLFLLVGLGSDLTPSLGTSILAVQIMAFKTQVRKSSLSQDLW